MAAISVEIEVTGATFNRSDTITRTLAQRLINEANQNVLAAKTVTVDIQDTGNVDDPSDALRLQLDARSDGDSGFRPRTRSRSASAGRQEPSSPGFFGGRAIKSSTMAAVSEAVDGASSRSTASWGRFGRGAVIS